MTVHRVDQAPHGEAGTVIRAITRANPGEIVVVRFPGSAIHRIDRLHQLLVHARSRVSLPMDIAIVWTMDRDQNSLDLLALTLDTPLPGPLHVNWPAWTGAPNIPGTLAARVAD